MWLLGWALVTTLLRRVFTRRKSGIAHFRANYDADALPPVSPEERVAMAEFGRCIACGLCDRGEAKRIAASGGEYRGVMPLVLAASRSMPDYGSAARSFRHVPDDVLAEKERICPTRVPFRRLARFVRDKASEVDTLPEPVERSVQSSDDARAAQPAAAR